MNRLLAFVLGLMPALALTDSGLLEYGVADTVDIPAYAPGTPPDLLGVDPTVASATCTVTVDGTPGSCAGTLTWETAGTISYAFTVAETQGERITLAVVDDDADFIDIHKTYHTFDDTSARFDNLGNNQLISICIEDAPTTCISLRKALCAILAEATGQADYVPGTSTWTVQNPGISAETGGDQNRLELIYGDDDGDRSSAKLFMTDC